MIKMTLDEIKTMAVDRTNYPPDKIYLHWTAGRYEQLFEEYQFNITGDGDIYSKAYTLRSGGAHTYQRNTGAIGIALCCAYNASPNKYTGLAKGDYQPTLKQIDAMAKLIAVLAKKLEIAIEPENIMTHAEAADLDGYGPITTCERWDLWKLKDYDDVVKDGGYVLRGKAKWYISKEIV